ncbi:Charged multivesicular body protein [Echinococcus granulosus]|uniref:Charged multivesicular body protein 5 n=1 Tax=Echinococcus granulosus TaxID=6210 RepID=W6U2E6_ECHGR|nr:Charged multivesicular body protein [Echinococcus granulosus]EUB54721.1 Charged multivesicular body protein [Echinococcus granulosus]
MHRVFGRPSNSTKAPPSLTDAAANIDSRIETLDKSIGLKRGEIAKLQSQMRGMREGPAKNSLKRQALTKLKQMKALEAQRETLSNQSFNMGQASFALQNVKDTQTTVKAMKHGVKEFKKEAKNMKLDDIEDLQDDLADMLELNDEFGEALGRSVMPTTIDESELDAELEALGAEADLEGFLDADTAPSVPSADIGSSISVPNAPNAAASGNVPLDEFGLPQI